jgi:hypothetical protein
MHSFRNPLALAAVFAVVAAAAPALAQPAPPLVSQTGKVSVQAPQGWQVNAQGDTFVIMKQPADEAALIFMIIDQADAKKALKGIDKLVKSFATKVKWSKKPKAAELNGLKGINIDGSAVVQGKAALTTMMLLGPTPSGKGVLIFGALRADKAQVHMPTILATFQSLKPVQ